MCSPGSRHQVVDVGDAAGDRILDRDHAEIGLAGDKRRKAILESRAGHRLVVRIGLTAGEMRIRARLALKNDLLLGHVSPCRAFRTQTLAVESTGQQLARLLQFFRRVDPERHAFHDHRIDAHAGVQRPQLLELLASLVAPTAAAYKTLERRAAIGIEPDVVIVRSGARCIGPGEGCGVKAAGRDLGEPDTLTTLGFVRSAGSVMIGGERCDVDVACRPAA